MLLIRFVFVKDERKASGFTFFFASRNILEPAEIYIKTSLRSNIDHWKNFYRLFQLEIRTLDHQFEGIVREPLVYL